ncbi:MULTISPECIES: chromosome segregation protein SMC [Schaalia]|uniref:chromosome segregation protein SMC n=1 Tax=Schaalia TaxID=2529408 RepID=UPI0026EF6E0A|nr:chromosome segregation protein SMC [Schaalia hyovaginalis]MCI6557049.1 chromosome segregation protein SMC [Schaalia hyovaginalis]MDD7553639.1 chromosome segregation protein SMC [Schaalia hyovaginalis]MDY3094087.1 chromosome segregation protein SMC [Schaalia hyovaginalis]
MHLKTLTLRGFKSFASSTTLRLEPGITCVVGPNGSGKSNVVDALAWVMGEQGAKTLRGSNMSDVVFAGTSARPALGRAQVELTIDNADGALPIDYTEVTISRTLFRGGGSEYAINGTPARLLDIQELLSDTGMGRQMHVIVGQGRLDSILQATPEERRGFIEEAAGVLKHRRRKERALKKLADMDANLVRVLDLTQEIQRQLGPLARQARTARKASLIQARVRDAKARLLADDLVDARERLAVFAQSGAKEDERRQALETRIEELIRRIGELEEEERTLGPALDEANRRWREITALAERLRGTERTAGERVRNLSRPTPEPMGEDPAALEERAEAAGLEDGRLLDEVEEAKTALAALIRAKDEAEEADRRATAELAQANRVIADRRERIARLTGDLASATTRLEAAQAEAERAEKGAADARKRAEAAEAELAGMPEAPEGEGTGEAGQSHRLAVEARDAARAAVDELLAAEREARADRAHWEARRDALAQATLQDDDTSRLLGREGVAGPVPDFLTVEKGAENAIAALLAPFADAVLVDGLEAALAHARAGEEAASGQLRMLISKPGELSTGSPAPEGARWACELVTVEPTMAGTLAPLLEGAVVVPDLLTAERVIGEDGVKAAVTRGGALIRRESLIGSGAATDSLLALKAQMDEAAAHAETAHEVLAAIDGRLKEANLALDAAVKRANEALRALREEDAAQARAAQERARAHSAAQAAASEAARARATAEKARDHIEWARERVVEARLRLESLEAEAPNEDLDAAKAAAEQAAAAARSAREAETAARLNLRALEERSRQAQSRARSLRAQAAKEREERRRFSEAEASRVRALGVARQIENGARLGVEAAARALEEAERERSRAEERRRLTAERTGLERSRLEEARSALADANGRAQRDGIARAQVELRVEEFERRAFEELSLEAEDLIAEFGPHTLVPKFPDDPDLDVEAEAAPYVRSEQAAALDKASKELARLGRVNPLALEEHDALAKRHEFLVSQVKDLRHSKADLLTIIDDVDRLVEEAFTSAFIDTREQFAHTFDVLFPGGTGDLILTDPDSPLDTGIEIEARPAGKKVKRMSLLSGGERSLAAIAFLVAIFKARPSPFYVMDEVEAALDDVNLSRLLTIFKELREESQLIIVTHQKRTMEIADALYGVTMRDGVTGVVSQRLDR